MSHVSLNVIQICHVITNNSDATKLFYCSHIYFKVNNLYIIHIYKCTFSRNEKQYHLLPPPPPNLFKYSITGQTLPNNVFSEPKHK
jgi:hypothetical protein